MLPNPLAKTKYVETPMEAIEGIHARLTQSFFAGKTRPLEFRKRQLRKLYYAIVDNSEMILAALKADLNKPVMEATMAELGWLEKDIIDTLDNIDKWTSDESAEVPFMLKLVKPRLQKNPMGTVLIIGPWNFPIQLVMVPLIGAIAAGCTAIVKPSELAPYSSAVVTYLVQQVLDPDCYAVVNGGIPETTKLLDLKWDKIMYTGNGTIGRIVAKAAVKHLTPVILELGGSNPTFITAKADAKLAARRIVWGKTHNCGQICLSPNYVLLDPSVETAFVESYIQTLNKFYPNGTRHDEHNYARMINERHFNRVTGLLQSTKGKVVYGGKSDAAAKWIEPTLIKVDSLDDPLLSDEIFGPLLPYLVVPGGLPEMTSIVRKLGDCPLGLYAFTNDKKEQDYVLNNTRSGGVTFNDTLFHGIIPTVPFGGVGESGNGVYRGKYTIDAFVHKRPVVNQPTWLEGMLGMRYPPFTDKKLATFRSRQKIPPANFDRNGKLLYDGLFWRIVLLGGSMPRAGLLRYLLVALCTYILFFSKITITRS